MTKVHSDTTPSDRLLRMGTNYMVVQCMLPREHDGPCRWESDEEYLLKTVITWEPRDGGPGK